MLADAAMIDSFILPSHERTAKSAISAEHGGGPEFLDRHCYGPGARTPV